MVYLRNDQEVRSLLDRKDGWLQQLGGAAEAKPTKKRPANAVEITADPKELVRQAYLRTVSRMPTEREASLATEHLTAASNLSDGLRDLMWALVNTKEFVVNR